MRVIFLEEVNLLMPLFNCGINALNEISAGIPEMGNLVQNQRDLNKTLCEMSFLVNKELNSDLKFPKDYQFEVLKDITNVFEKQADKGIDKRTTVVLPCGTGKSLIGLVNKLN